MHSNGLLKWLLLPIVALAVFVVVRVLSRGPDPATAPTARDAQLELTSTESKALGVAGDTPRDTVATLVGQVKELRKEVDAAVKENKVQKTENEQLRQNARAIDQRIQNALTAERERQSKDREKTTKEQAQTQSLIDDLRHRLDSVGGKPTPSDTDLPVGLGLEDDERAGSEPESLRWVEPTDTLPDSTRKAGTSRRNTPRAGAAATGSSFAPAAESVQRALGEASDAVSDVGMKSVSLLSTRPVYTVPDDATLTGSVAMTALIGRVPIEGTVHDAYPFKVLIGADNLSANGIELPDVAGAVASGTASGDWTLSCVRGQIRSFTFVFNDGTVRTIKDASASGGGSGARSTDGGLGWISDPAGIPCVTGVRRDNAQQYLTTQALVTAAGAAAASLIKSENGSASFITGRDGNVLGTVGISGNEAMGRILGAGVQDISEWVKKLYGQSFAAIYVPPGAPVAVHIERSLAIDYDPQGRKVAHHTGEFDETDLD